MGKANNTLSLGSAAYTAKRAADIVFALQNKDRLDVKALAARLNEILKVYGETEPDITPADLDELKTVARKFYVLFEDSDTTKAASLLNLLLSKYAKPPRLSAHSGTPWHLHVDSDDHAPWAEWFAASSAWALATLFAEKQQNPAGLCASPLCGRPFIDLGKGGGRKYCSPKCATRERVATYRKTRKK